MPEDWYLAHNIDKFNKLIYKTKPNDFDLQLGCCISDAFLIFNFVLEYLLKWLHLYLVNGMLNFLSDFNS
jgi:hypothetical protein